jgi:Rieske 2Fe-2S family protein
VLVVRGPDLKVRAFFDVCRHRGASIVGREACGRTARFECPYHGWTYELDGRGREPLRAVEVQLWRGFVLIALCNDPTPIGEAPPWLEELPPLRLGRRTSWTTKANWKFIGENFQETLHFPRVHKELEALTPAEDAFTWLGTGRWLGGTMNIQAETVSATGKLDGRPLIGKPGKVFDALLFPCLLTSLQPDYLLLYRLSPLAVDETRIEFDIWFHAAADVNAPAVYELWDRINSEDRAIVEDQQQNTGSRAFEPTCYEPVEEGMHAFDRLVAKAYLE